MPVICIRPVRPKAGKGYICIFKSLTIIAGQKKKMNVLSTYKQRWHQIPSEIRRMIVTGTILLAVWKTLYTFWLEPARTIDQPLTILVAGQTASILKFFWPGAEYSVLSENQFKQAQPSGPVEHMYILKNGKPTISIADNCNGLELMVLYGAFIICMPGKQRRKWAYILAGIPLIHIANLGRCMGLVGMHLQWPGLFDFAHHYLFKIMVYAISFGLWVAYLKPITNRNTDA